MTKGKKRGTTKGQKRIAKLPPQIFLKTKEDGTYYARYEWGQGTSKCLFSAIALAIRHRLAKPRPKDYKSIVPYFGEWYGRKQETPTPIEKHRSSLLEDEDEFFLENEED